MKIETRKAKWLTSALLLWLAAAPLGQAFYNPNTGKWLTRDPIEEKGSRILEKSSAARSSDRPVPVARKRKGQSPIRAEELNLYAFLENAPTVYVDIDGRQAASGGGKGALPNQPYPAQPIGCSLTCCSDEKIEEGRKALRRSYLQAVQAANILGLTAVESGTQGASCKNSSRDIINWLLPNPACWYCHLEERDWEPHSITDRDDLGTDHQFIICNAYGTSGEIKKQIMFDWWGQNKSGKPYGEEDPGIWTRGTYHSPNQQVSPKHFVDCQGTTHGKPLPKDFNASTATQ